MSFKYMYIACIHLRYSKSRREDRYESIHIKINSKSVKQWNSMKDRGHVNRRVKNSVGFLPEITS